jgi:hypothetical protein
VLLLSVAIFKTVFSLHDFPFHFFPLSLSPELVFVLRPLLCLVAFTYQPPWGAVQFADIYYLVSVLAVEILFGKLLCVRPTFFSPALFCFILQCSLSDLVFQPGTCCRDRSQVLVGIIIIIIISCHRFSFFPGTSALQPVVNPTTQASSLSL